MKGAIETMVGVVLIAFMAVLSTAYISCIVEYTEGTGLSFYSCNRD